MVKYLSVKLFVKGLEVPFGGVRPPGIVVIGMTLVFAVAEAIVVRRIDSSEVTLSPSPLLHESPSHLSFEQSAEKAGESIPGNLYAFRI